MKINRILGTATVMAVGLSVAGCPLNGGGDPATGYAVGDCPADKQDVTITYGVNAGGKSELTIKEKVQVKPDGAVVFKLDPKSAGSDVPDFGTYVVTVKGKATDPNSSWISDSDSYDNNPELVVCVPQGQPEGIYQYEVEVAGFGMLDPRLDVKN